MRAAVICREMKWTYTEYMDQPSWFIDILCKLFNAESEHNKKAK